MNAKIKKSLNLLLRTTIVLATYGFLFYELFVNNKFSDLNLNMLDNNLSFYILAVVFLLMPLNWGIESIKWRFLIRKVEKIKLPTAFKAVPYAKNTENTTRFEGKTLAEIKAEIKAELDTEKFNDILARLDALEDKTASMSVVTQHGVPTVRFSAVNLQVVSGAGTTAGAINGSGNLLVGYNSLGATKTGSHNLIVGEYQSYSSYGGAVFGYFNTVSERYSSVLGGTSNEASGYYSSVTGGDHNDAIADKSSITGGAYNIANNINSFIGGGYYNVANANYSSILGGNENITSGMYGVVLGGRSNLASGSYSSVSAGRENIASGFCSSVSGGGGTGDLMGFPRGNEAAGDYSTIGGGTLDSVSGEYNWKAGSLFEAQ